MPHFLPCYHVLWAGVFNRCLADGNACFKTPLLTLPPAFFSLSLSSPLSVFEAVKMALDYNAGVSFPKWVAGVPWLSGHGCANL